MADEQNDSIEIQNESDQDIDNLMDSEQLQDDMVELRSVLSLDSQAAVRLQEAGITSLEQLSFAESDDLSQLGLTLGQKLNLRRWKNKQTGTAHSIC